MTRLQIILGLVFTFVSTITFAQVTINHSPNVAEVMEIKKEVAKNENIYQIQIYNGNIGGVDEAMNKAKEQLKNYIAQLTFETPNYKVRIGSFRTRLEAEKKLTEVKKVFPAAFVMSPKK